MNRKYGKTWEKWDFPIDFPAFSQSRLVLANIFVNLIWFRRIPLDCFFGALQSRKLYLTMGSLEGALPSFPFSQFSFLVEFFTESLSFSIFQDLFKFWVLGHLRFSQRFFFIFIFHSCFLQFELREPARLAELWSQQQHFNDVRIALGGLCTRFHMITWKIPILYQLSVFFTVVFISRFVTDGNYIANTIWYALRMPQRWQTWNQLTLILICKDGCRSGQIISRDTNEGGSFCQMDCCHIIGEKFLHCPTLHVLG